ncbi:hypothetical protein RQN30_06790 [Arcanobacterium hippocoleae]
MNEFLRKNPQQVQQMQQVQQVRCSTPNTAAQSSIGRQNHEFFTIAQSASRNQQHRAEFEPNSELFPREPLASAAYYGTEPHLYQELSDLAELIGVEIISARKNRMSGTQPAAVLNFTQENCAEDCVRASFHPSFAPYFASGSVELNVKTDSAEILELLAAVGATLRGQVLGLIGTQGGIGTSTTAVWIAREFARRHHSAAVIDLNPSSAGIDLIFSGVGLSGKRWHDIRGSGSMLANRLTNSLPSWKGVRFLSADLRGGVDLASGNGEKAIAALSQVHEWTVLDLPTRALDPADSTHKWLEWCDALLILSGVNTVSLACTQARLADFGSCANFAVVAVGAKTRGHLADISAQLGLNTIFGLRRQKSLPADLDHGLTPGDKNRSGTAKDIRTICSALIESSEIDETQSGFREPETAVKSNGSGLAGNSAERDSQKIRNKQYSIGVK